MNNTNKTVFRTSVLLSKNFIKMSKVLAIGVNPIFAQIYGELIDKFNYIESKGALTEHGEFFYTIPELAKNTGWSIKPVRTCLQTMREFGLISTRTAGVPQKIHYTINVDSFDLLYVTIQIMQNLEKHTRIIDEICTKIDDKTQENDIISIAMEAIYAKKDEISLEFGVSNDKKAWENITESGKKYISDHMVETILQKLPTVMIKSYPGLLLKVTHGNDQKLPTVTSISKNKYNKNKEQEHLPTEVGLNDDFLDNLPEMDIPSELYALPEEKAKASKSGKFNSCKVAIDTAKEFGIQFNASSKSMGNARNINKKVNSKEIDQKIMEVALRYYFLDNTRYISQDNHCLSHFYSTMPKYLGLVDVEPDENHKTVAKIFATKWNLQNNEEFCLFLGKIIKNLLKADDISAEDAVSCAKWWEMNNDSEFCPIITDISTLVDKFIKLLPRIKNNKNTAVEKKPISKHLEYLSDKPYTKFWESYLEEWSKTSKTAPQSNSLYEWCVRYAYWYFRCVALSSGANRGMCASSHDMKKHAILEFAGNIVITSAYFSWMKKQFDEGYRGSLFDFFPCQKMFDRYISLQKVEAWKIRGLYEMEEFKEIIREM